MAHPDDEVLGCGATIHKFSQEGMLVHLLIMATGLASRGVVKQEALESLKKQTRDAANSLGVFSVEFADFPDNQMDSKPLLEIVKRVEKFIEAIQPDIVFTHHNGDINIDHVITQRAVLTACRPLPASKSCEIFACQVQSSSDFGRSDEQLRADCYVRLSEENVSAALRALSFYHGEIKDWPHPRSKNALEYKLRIRGSECGYHAAEAFEVLRLVR